MWARKARFGNGGPRGVAHHVFEVNESDFHTCQGILVSLGGNQGRTIGRAVGLAICLVGQNKGSREHNFFKKKIGHL